MARERETLESTGRSEVHGTPLRKLYIAEDDPNHPNHHEHVARTRIDDPDMIVLLESFRAFGWIISRPAPAYLDGARYCMSDGRRALVAARVVEAEWRAARPKDKRLVHGDMLARIFVDRDPALTESVANSMRKGDPPLVIARRFVQFRETTGAAKAAAAVGLSLADANNLAAVLANPNAELQKAVNERRVPSDVAARAAKKGSAAVQGVIAKSRDADGKIDGKKAERAVKEGHETRPKARAANLAISFRDEAERLGINGQTLAVLRWFAGDNDALAGYAQIAKALESATGALGK